MEADRERNRAGFEAESLPNVSKRFDVVSVVAIPSSHRDGRGQLRRYATSSRNADEGERDNAFRSAVPLSLFRRRRSGQQIFEGDGQLCEKVL